MAKKKLYIKTYGCQMNVYDSDKMADLMSHCGYETCETVDNADMVILNTCHIREKAAEKMYSELGRIKKNRKDHHQEMIIAVAGCVGQAEGEEIFKRAPYVDVVVGPQSYQSLPDLVGKIKRDSGQHLINLEFEDDKFDQLPESRSDASASAFLSIQEGCDKFCTFCVVPYTRGAEYSRPVADIYREAISLVAKGAKEITLLGQNVNAYHGIAGDETVWNLGKLMAHLSTISGLERLRYSTSHPRDMHAELYEQHGTNPKVMPFLNLPVQSGSDAILEAMNRKHTRDYYFKIADKLRQLRPDMQFGSDFIVGFPGETDQDFEDTLDLIRRVNFVQGYSFKYSPRPGTPGAELEDQVDEAVKDERLQRLQALINSQQQAYNNACVGNKMNVLFERKGKHNNQWIGRSPYMHAVYVESESSLIGQLHEVLIESAGPNSLKARLV